MDLIIKSSQKYIDSNKTKESYNILLYCLKYFIQNPHDTFVISYIHQHIIVDYYNNNKILLNEVIDLININKKSTNNLDKERIFTLLIFNKVNIEYYKNKDLIYVDI
jgi:predicted peptidase